MCQEDNQSVIPTFEVLQNSAQIQQKVQKRYQELENYTDTEQGNITLNTLVKLLQNKNEQTVKNKVKWPQDYVFVGEHRRKVTYEALDECQWVLGFLRDRQRQTDPLKRENMIAYLTEIMQDAVDFGFISAKGAHFVLVNQLIEG